MSQDIVAQLPDELAYIEKKQGKLPDDVELESHYFCRWDQRCFIHARATLPLHDFDEGIGFGLWVEVPAAELEKYLAAENDDDAYKNFKTTGILANQWPGFLDMLGVGVVVRTVRVEEKVYITEVHSHITRDPIFEHAIRIQKGDVKARENLLNLIQAYLVDGGVF